MDFLPQSHDDPGWHFSQGERQVTGGALDAISKGLPNFFFFSRAKIGRDFEVRGEFDVIQGPKQSFQAGLIMGVPDYGEQSADTLKALTGSPFTPGAASISPGGFFPQAGGAAANFVVAIPGAGGFLFPRLGNPGQFQPGLIQPNQQHL